MNMLEDMTELENRINQLAMIANRFKSQDYSVSFDLNSNAVHTLYVMRESQGVIFSVDIGKETTSEKFNDIVQLLTLLQRLSPVEEQE